MRTPKLRELKEALTSLFSKPYTVKFPYGPSIPPEEFRGKPKFVEEECIGCGACAQVCPGRAIDVTDVVSGNTGKRKLTVHYDHCIFCGQCQRYCTTEKGIVLTNDYDTPTYDRTQAVSEVEKNLVICEHCGAVVGTEDHIRWVARKLGTKAYAHLGLALVLHKDLGLLPEEAIPEPGAPIDRSSHISFLCPKCRREIILYEQWGP